MSGHKIHRNTLQRTVILEELQKLNSHPTASELHILVQKRLPKISLGTVYRNLEYLSRRGLAQKLTISGNETRFDATVEHHQHVRCVQCSRVDDAAVPPFALPHAGLQDVGGYKILGYRLEFYGVCPECRRTGSESGEDSDPHDNQ
jgi:Fur family transcriptional regulator, ferric uptake regulator